MKKVFSFFLSILFLSLATQSAIAGKVETKGKWGDDRIRTIAPAMPEVSEEGRIISIYFADAISNLSVTITDANNQIMYQEVLSEGAGSTYVLPLSLDSGVYQISMIQPVYGYLYGSFIVD